ncbi:Uncharacterized protein FKW44_003011, partial [Caligus rogercresseyi]
VDNAEGFLCPSCMQSFDNPEALHSHFLTEHDNDTPHNRSSSIGEHEDDSSFGFKEDQSLYSEGSSVLRKTPSESERLAQSVSDYSLSTSKLTLPQDDDGISQDFKGECSRCVQLTSEHASQVQDLENRIGLLSKDISAKEEELGSKKSQRINETNTFNDLIQSKDDEICLLQESINALKCDKKGLEETESIKASEFQRNY